MKSYLWLTQTSWNYFYKYWSKFKQ